MINPGNISTIYVSQKTGDDGKGTGMSPYCDKTKNGPLKSVERAFSFIRQLRQAGYLQSITIKLMDEVFAVEKTIVIDPDISDIVIEPYTKTVVCGGRRVTNFKDDIFNGVQCFSAEIPEVRDGVWYTDFYVDGVRADFSRYPDSGTLEPVSVENDSFKLYTHCNWFIAKKEDFKIISGFRNLSDCIISYNHLWIDEHTGIAGVDKECCKVEFKTPSTFSLCPDSERRALHYVVENVAETFSKPNEWYLDRETAKLYYIPRTSEQTPENIHAYLPVCDKLFEVKGTREKSVENVYIRNLDIAYTRGESEWLLSDGYVGSSAVQSTHSGRGTVEMEYAKKCSIENCNIYCTGVYAVRLGKGSKGIRITDNNINNTGAGAIVSGGGAFGEDVVEFNSNNVIHNNVMRTLGRRYAAACGVLLCHSFDNVVSHNEISDLYYTGISVGWKWGYGDSISRDNIIEYNHIYDIGKGVLSDMGGIYLLGKQQGTIVRNNLIHDVESKHYGGWGIYTDEGSSYMRIEKNICYNLSCNCFHQHYGSMNTVCNNIFFKAKEHPVKLSRNEMHVSAIFERNIIISEGTSIYNLAEAIFDDPTMENLGNVHILGAHNNILFDTKREEVSVITIGDADYSLEKAQLLLGLEEGSSVKNPKLREDFIPLDSTLLESYGIVPIDVKKIGVLR